VAKKFDNESLAAAIDAGTVTSENLGSLLTAGEITTDQLTYAIGYVAKRHVPAAAPTSGTVKGGMVVEIRGKRLHIEMDLETPAPSASGKTLVIGSSHGNVTTSAMLNGKPIVIGVNAYIKR